MVPLPKDYTREEFKEITEDDHGLKAPWRKLHFTNEHGESYEVLTDGVTVWIVGSETDNLVINLFNPSFNIWSREELNKLGKVLALLTEEDAKKI